MPVHAEFAPTKFLPDIALESVPEGRPVRLRPPAGQATVLVAVHSARCAGCRQYLEALAGSAGEFQAWDGRLLVVAPEPLAIAADLRAPFGETLCDGERSVSSPDSAAVVVSDRYAHIYDVRHAGAGHRFPAPRELEEWLKFLATQCPE